MTKTEYYVTPITPGEILKEEFLESLGLSQYRLAKEIGVPAGRIGQIIANKRAITADTDLRLCKFFGLPEGYWLRAQAAYDIDVAAHELADEIDKITQCNKIFPTTNLSDPVLIIREMHSERTDQLLSNLLGNE